MSFETLPHQVRNAPFQSVFGRFEPDSGSRKLVGANDADAVADVWTVAVNGTAASQAYTGPQVVDDETGEVLYADFTHTVGVADTTTTLQAASLVTAWNLSAGASYFRASNSSNTITFTGLRIGQALTIQESDANLGTPSRTTTAGLPANILPGRLVIADSTSGRSRVSLKHPVAADFTAQVITYTYGSVGTDDVVQATILYRGESISEKALYTASQTATLAALATALNSAIDARWGAGYSIAVTSDATTVVFTAEVAGDEFDAVSSVVGAGAGTEAKAWTAGPTSATSLLRRLKGVPEYSNNLRARQSSGNVADSRPVYRGYATVQCQLDGVVFVESSQAISTGDPVFVGVDTTNPGRFNNAAGANLIYLPARMAQWESDENTDNNQGGARLRVNL